MFIDTHAHVNFTEFQYETDAVMRRALDMGMVVINVGTQAETSRQAVEMAENYSNTYAVVGMHPDLSYPHPVNAEDAAGIQAPWEKFDYEMYKRLAQHPKVVGIGECGLDYFRLPQEVKHEAEKDSREEIKQLQKDAFTAQLNLALELNKSLVIHSRSSKGTDDACLDILEILKKKPEVMNHGLRFVLHSYTGSPEVAGMFVDLGAYISFNGIITFDKTGNQEEVLKIVPDDKILLETDCPFLTPVPMRGKKNEPGYVRFVADHVARLKGLSVDEVANITTSNARKFFSL